MRLWTFALAACGLVLAADSRAEEKKDNKIPVKKLDVKGLLDVPLFDVSPGEMYYTSLQRYFARPRSALATDSRACSTKRVTIERLSTSCTLRRSKANSSAR